MHTCIFLNVTWFSTINIKATDLPSSFMTYNLACCDIAIVNGNCTTPRAIYNCQWDNVRNSSELIKLPHS